MNILFTGNGLLQITLYFLVLFICIKPLGAYMARVYNKPLSRLERACYKIAGIDCQAEMNWKQYTYAVLIFSLGNFILLYSILRWQSLLPLNPEGMKNLSPDLAFNIAVSFVTNTNWQSYGGESTLSYFSQVTGLTVQNFVSAGVGLAVLIALIRGLSRKNTKKIGNFWLDLFRSCLYILLPLAFIYAVILGSQGVVQSFGHSLKVPLIESVQLKGQTEKLTEQTIAIGPAASQVAIKQLGANGGGFFNANSAHPFENPTPLSNFLEMLAILLIPSALCYTFGVMIGDTRQGWSLLATMTLIFVPLIFCTLIPEQIGNPALTPLGIDQHPTLWQAGGNMEGKESRFGIVNSILWTTSTTAAANGSVNSMLDSYTAMGGFVSLLLMQLGEIIYGGVGSGLYGMLIFVLITVFIAGLMVGRTPEYLGKKIQSFEIKMASIVILIMPIMVLIGTAIACLTQSGRAGVLNPGAHSFSEILYAFSSTANNNGSAFAGLKTNTPFYNCLLGIIMLFGRFWVIVPILAIAGSMADKKIIPASVGTLSTHRPLFIIFLVSIILLTGILTFLPALALGPIAEFLK